jgi:anti-sigma factor RsiW
MSHLSRTQLLDLVEDLDAADRHRRHLESCEECRATAAALRATIAEVRRDDETEPSPLFWDHFTARVSEAIRDESPTATEHTRLAWLGGYTAAWAAAALIVLLGMTTLVWRVTLHAPTSVVSAPVAEGPSRPAVDTPDPDEEWTEVVDAVATLQWDEVQAAGITARPGSAEGVVMELTADERVELARLIEREMKRSGA